MNALKTLVIGLGVVIVVATAVLIYVIVERMTGGGGFARSRGAASVPHLALPEGAVIAEAKLAENRLLVATRLANGEERLYVLDLDLGRVIATVGTGVAPETGQPNVP